MSTLGSGLDSTYNLVYDAEIANSHSIKKEIEQDIKILTQQALDQLGKFLSNLDVKENQIKGMGLRALNNLSENYQNMCQMMSQIAQWIETGKVAKNKILSLFNTQFRYINRGKAGKKIEFGLKWGINQIRGGYVSIFMHSDMMCHDANYAVLGVQEHIRKSKTNKAESGSFQGPPKNRSQRAFD